MENRPVSLRIIVNGKTEIIHLKYGKCEQCPCDLPMLKLESGRTITEMELRHSVESMLEG